MLRKIFINLNFFTHFHSVLVLRFIDVYVKQFEYDHGSKLHTTEAHLKIDADENHCQGLSKLHYVCISDFNPINVIKVSFATT